VIDDRATHHLGYATSQRQRRRVEEILGWLKAVAKLCAKPAIAAWEGRLDVYLRDCRQQLGPNA
jgi:hypothetical protein